MLECSLYKKELALFALSFRERATKQPWRDYSLAKAERMLFVGFLYVRKLIESLKVSDVCARSSVAILRTPHTKTPEASGSSRYDLVKSLETVAWARDRVDIHHLSGKVLQASPTIPVQDDARGLAGFMFATERHGNPELWLVPTPAIADAFERIAESSAGTHAAAGDGPPARSSGNVMADLAQPA
jgi:hypothetical protein